MAIHTEEKKTMQAGFMKTIDQSGFDMMFDLVQKYQYSYPVKSTVRELVSNGLDSITERNMAIEILTGKAKVEDYFVDLEGEVYKDSHFDPSYYDIQWLSNDPNVTLLYKEGNNITRDSVTITDNGVGLGGERLEKYFRLGYSTKRLSKLPLGKFGVGAKSPLSIGAEFYTMESRYNGKLFRFNIYSHKIDSIIPAMNLEKGTTNDFVVFNKGAYETITLPDGTEERRSLEYKVYYTTTTEKNGVSIILEAKKHHKSQYSDAIKQQMLYFDNINCIVESPDGKQDFVDYRAKIMYEDDYIVISDNQYFTQPHLLLNKVNYGLIDWNELELETKRGNIGIKVAPEEVEVNPSRESVLWTEKTKAMVLGRFNDVVTIASNMIQKELQETDVIRWLKVCSEISATSWERRSSVLGRLASIVDLSKVKLKYPLFDKLEYDATNVLPGIPMKYVEYKERKLKDASKRMSDEDDDDEAYAESVRAKKYIARNDTKRIVGNVPLVLMPLGGRSSNRKDKWLLKLYNNFILLREPVGTKEQAEEFDISAAETDFYVTSGTTGIFRQELWEHISRSTGVIKYEEVIVPDTFKGTDDEDLPEEAEEETTAEEKKQAAISAAERRKLEGKTIIHIPVTKHPFTIKESEVDSFTGKETKVSRLCMYEFTKVEIPYAKINEWKQSEVYYGNAGDTKLMNFIAFLTRDPTSGPGRPKRSYADTWIKWQESKYFHLHKKEIGELKISTNQDHYWLTFCMQHYFDSPIKLIKVAQSNNIHYRDFRKVQEFFFTIKNKTVSMSNLLIEWNTARIIKDKLADAAFLYNFDQFNPVYAKMYRKLCNYVNKYYREIGKHTRENLYGIDQVTYEDLLKHLNDVQQFQEFVGSNNATPESIAELAGRLFGNRELQNGMAVDPEIMSLTAQILEYAHTAGDMLNNLPLLTGHEGPGKSLEYIRERKEHGIPPELAYEIIQYLEYKGVPKYEQDKPAPYGQLEQSDYAVQEN